MLGPYLPPVEIGALVAGSMLNLVQDMESRGDRDGATVSMHELLEWCGNVPVAELIARILKKNPPPWPSGPQPEPWSGARPESDPWRGARLTGPSLLVIGSVLTSEAKRFKGGVANAVTQTGEALLERGLQQMDLKG